MDWDRRKEQGREVARFYVYKGRGLPRRKLIMKQMVTARNSKETSNHFNDVQGLFITCVLLPLLCGGDEDSKGAPEKHF